MKIRAGFVANSSTSSFIVYGWIYNSGNEDYDYMYEQDDVIKHLVEKFDLDVTKAKYNRQKKDDYMCCFQDISGLLSEKFNVKVDIVYSDAEECNIVIGKAASGLEKEEIQEMLNSPDIDHIKEVFGFKDEPSLVSGIIQC